MQYLVESGFKANTISRYVSDARGLHARYGFLALGTDHLRNSRIRIYKTTPSGAPRPRLPFTLEQLLRIRAVMQLSTPLHAGIWAMMMLQLHTSTRSEAIAMRTLYSLSDKLLLVSDVDVHFEDGCLVVFRNWKWHPGEVVVVPLVACDRLPEL